MILNYFFKEKKSKNLKFFKVVFVLSLLFCISKNILRIENSDLRLFPQTVNNENKQIFKNTYTLDLRLLRVKNGLCFYTKSVCSHEIPENIKVKKFNNYYILTQ